jgi:hypothetical protein
MNVPLHDAVPQRAAPERQYGTAALGAPADEVGAKDGPGPALMAGVAVGATKGAGVERGSGASVGSAVPPRLGTEEGESAAEEEHNGSAVPAGAPVGSVLNQTMLDVVNT